MAKEKSINLTPRTKPKKEDKYSEKASVKREYKHALKSRVVYVGLLDDYSGLECETVKRSRRKITEFYTIKFDDEEIISDISGNFLMTPEEYQLYLLDTNNENNQNDLTEFEIELMKQGLESYKNYVQCLSPRHWYQMACDRCGYEGRCVCRKKYKYKKID